MPPLPKMKTTDFHLIDKQIKNINQRPGVILIPSPLAWEKYGWIKKYLEQKPVLGYFVWIKKSQPKPLSSCISLETAGFQQKLNNLIVIEPKTTAELLAICNSTVKNVSGLHDGRSTIVIKENASLTVSHQHFWGPRNIVKPKIEIRQEKNSRLKYIYKNLTHPRQLDLSTKIYLAEKAKANSQVIIEAKENFINIDEKIIIKGKDAAGELNLRLAAKQNSKITARSQIKALAAGRGHLDCRGLITDEKTRIELVPELINHHPQALITHEASIGRIEKEKLEYLQTRGLSEKQALDLIIKGFLTKKND